MDSGDNVPVVIEEQVPQQAPLPIDQPVRVPLYRRDLHPTNLVLSAEDLKEFCELLADANERSKQIEYAALKLGANESPEHAQFRISELMPIDYEYVAGNGDSMRGLGIPKTEERTFPDDLVSLFASNSTYAQRAINNHPMNTVEAFICFEKPSLKIDLQTLPSNPTENRSVINVAGRDEDWVISTAQKIEDFFKSRKATRPIIHGSGAYDYLIYLLVLPVLVWIIYKNDTQISNLLGSTSIFLNVILGIYGLLLSLLIARFAFQYSRWLFPPMEYYKRNRWPAFVHRGVAGFVAITIAGAAITDVASSIWSALFP